MELQAPMPAGRPGSLPWSENVPEEKPPGPETSGRRLSTRDTWVLLPIRARPPSGTPGRGESRRAHTGAERRSRTRQTVPEHSPLSSPTGNWPCGSATQSCPSWPCGQSVRWEERAGGDARCGLPSLEHCPLSDPRPVSILQSVRPAQPGLSLQGMNSSWDSSHACNLPWGSRGKMRRGHLAHAA